MAEVILHKGEVFERVFLNEPEMNLHIVQEAGSRVKIHMLYLSPLPCGEGRGEVFIEQAGTDCSTEIYGLAYLRGKESVTTETHVHHSVGGGTSNQLIKFVLDDQARGRFIGDLQIAQDAQQTEAHQTNKNLLLSEEAEMRTQPQLEIYADDVKATHGASTGQLDESALFYMQQRGIDKQKARQLLVGAFMKEVIDRIQSTDRSLRSLIDRFTDGLIM